MKLFLRATDTLTLSDGHYRFRQIALLTVGVLQLQFFLTLNLTALMFFLCIALMLFIVFFLFLFLFLGSATEC